jgi:NAD(P)-dependent dehydrogenase (short-subunit alcohol dehydrogenase family)
MNQVAIVTGGASGIGKEIALTLARKGARVYSLDIQHARYGDVFSIECDVTQEQQVKESIESLLAKEGRIDILVNNAGGSLGASEALEIFDSNVWDRVIKLNLYSTFFCTKHAVKSMKAQRYGRIINISSLAGRARSVLGGVAYASAKAGVIGFVRQTSFELGEYGITVNAVAPGTVFSGDRIRGYWERKSPTEQEEFLKSVPLGRAGEVSEVAESVAFLASKEASYITGAVLDVNGGLWVG